MRIDSDFSGGNILVKRIDGQVITLQPDLRDTEGHWFYWYFRVRNPDGAAGQRLTFQFDTDGQRTVGVRGPAVSLDEGQTWSWLGAEHVEGESFHYTWPQGIEQVRLSVGVPYLERQLQLFLARPQVAGNPHVRVDTLCTSEKGRAIERLHLGRLDGRETHRILLTCRHHACEAMANYVLEGIMEAVLADHDDGRWFREHVECVVVPFVDKDGVEAGDQGKNRRPHDHNRDYGCDSLYASIRALRELGEQGSTRGDGRLHFFMDLHCPYIKDGDIASTNQYLYLVGSMFDHVWEQQQAFSRILESVQRGPLVFSAANNLPYGQAWNVGKNWQKGRGCGSSRWFSQVPGLRLATSIEIPYADASGQEVTPVNARLFGHDLARTIRGYLESP